MANSVIIAAGITAANSADIVVTAAAPATVHVYGAAGPYTAQILVKNNDSTYSGIGAVTSDAPARTIYGPGTYRVQRPTGGASCAVDLDQ